MHEYTWAHPLTHPCTRVHAHAHPHTKFTSLVVCHLCVSMGAYECSYPWNSEEDIRSLGAGIRGGGMPPDMGAGNATQILSNSSMHS